MELRLLGPVEVVADDGVAVDGGVPQRRAMLAALAVDAGRLVTRETLIDRVWDTNPPAGVRAAVYAHVTRIRGMLDQLNATRAGQAPARLQRQPGGYVLSIDPDLVDLHRFRRLVTRSQHAGDTERVELLRRAVALWRGEPLAGIQGAWGARMRQSWNAQRLETMVAWARAELAVGNPAEVLGPLTDLAGEHPLHEPLAAVLMSALAAAGRAGEALEHYTTIRQRLAEELGIDPRSELRTLYQAILRGDSPAPPADPLPPLGPTEARRTPVPAQLPGDVPGFTGRSANLDRLDTVLTTRRPGGSTAVVISAVSGTAGIGKTALAVHWAHRVRDRFPDGQLYVNLRGFDPTGRVMTPTEAVCGFLDALGVPPERVPTTMDAQVGLYRSLIADKRMLVVLDNARDAEQARPLLPATPTAVAIVTSRNRLASLTAADGADPVYLDLLTTAESRDLLSRRLGSGRVTTDPRATDQIIAGCARLPLALTIVAARARHTGFPLSALAAELDDARSRLDALDAGDTTAEVRAVFSWSYATLTTETARLFRLLGLHPGPDISTMAAGSLAGQSLQRVRRSLAELVRANLLTERLPGRFAFHDLLRVYAADLAYDTDSESARDSALTRLLDHYLHAATRAAGRLAPHVPPLITAISEEMPPADLPAFSSREQACEWFTGEQPNLVAVAGWAAAHHHTRAAVGIPAALHEHLRTRGPWTLARDLHRGALTEARRSGDQAGQARTLSNLADTQHLTDDYPGAAASAGEALELCRRLGDRHGEAGARYLLGLVRFATGEYLPAAASAGEALELCRRLGDRHGEAGALYLLGLVQHVTGEYAGAAASAGEALELCRELGDRYGQARALYILGHVQNTTGEYAAAAASAGEALELCRQLGGRLGQASASYLLGLVRFATGDHAAAAASAGEALELCGQLGDRYGQAGALHILGLVRSATGDHAAAATSLGQALELFQDVGDRDGEAEILNHLGELLLASGAPAAAHQRFVTALGIARSIGIPLHEARALEGLGDCALRDGRNDQAVAHLGQALAIYQRINSPHARRVEATLETVHR